MEAKTLPPVAIIGIGCRLPGNVADTEDLWGLLVDGRNAWSDVPPERFNEAAFYHPNPDNNGTTNHRGGHFISRNIAAFDAAFFGISPVEAQATDPQQRLLLETAYEAFENAGIPVNKVRGSNTAVYAATFTRDYDRNLYKDPTDIPKYQITGAGEAILSNRISYTFDLKGPSMTLDTGCSGGIVALHQACRSLQVKESDMALAAGVNLILGPDHMFGMSNLHMLNSSGRSYPFDARGSGYGRGEGAATVLLKRLDDALQAGDHIRAIIRGTAVGQDGKTNGITLPNQQAQENLARSLYQYAGLDPCSIRYLEAHGTGTKAGDIAELQAIANVFCNTDHRRELLYVGSIKSNIGHLESSSGLAGLIKTVLILEKGFIPPNADFQMRKEELKLDEWMVKVPSQLEPWPASEIRLASVNSFGYGGTNAHVILESAPLAGRSVGANDRSGDVTCIKGGGQETGRTGASTIADTDQRGVSTDIAAIANNPLIVKRPAEQVRRSGTDGALGSPNAISPKLFVLSAKSETSILEMARKLENWVSKRHNFDQYNEDLAYTLSSRRSEMQWRYSFVAGSHRELMASLASNSRYAKKTLSEVRVGFIFTGQGANWVGMGHELTSTHPRFAESLTRSDELLRELGAPWSLKEELMANKKHSRIHQSEIAQPASTAVQIALVDLLGNMGIKPQMVLGHSSGEIAAAYSAGVLSHATALKVSYHRSFVSSLCKRMGLSKGAMLVVGLAEKKVLPLLAETRKGVVNVACVNSPFSTTLSGDQAAISEVQAMVDDLGVFNRMLKVDTAYHSHHMRKIAHEYLSSLDVLATQPPNDSTKFLSSVTATEKRSGFDSAYWVENLASKVRFADALEEYCHTQIAHFQLIPTSSALVLIEIGPHSALNGPIRQTIAHSVDSLNYVYLPTLVRGRNAVHTILDLVGKLFEYGYQVDLENANSYNYSQYQPRVICNLPTYPWDHSVSYWHESRLSRDYRFRRYPYHDLLGTRLASSTTLEPQWRHMVSVENLPWLAEHVIDGLVIFPGAGYICMAIEAVRQATSDSTSLHSILNFFLKDVSFLKSLVVPPAPLKVEIQLTLKVSRTTPWHEFRVFALSQDGVWYEHCNGLVRAEVDLALDKDEQAESRKRTTMLTREAFLSNLTAECSETLSQEATYDQLRSSGNSYGPHFASLREVRIGKFQAVGHLRISDVKSTMPSGYMQPHIIHPATLDTLLHTSLPLYTKYHGPGAIMPVFIGELTISASIANVQGTGLTAAITLVPKGTRSAKVGITVFESDQEATQAPVLTVSQAELRGLGKAKSTDILRPSKPQTASYRVEWAADIDHLSLKKIGSSEISCLDDYLKRFYFKHSQVNILKIGAGVGSSTIPVLDGTDFDSPIPAKCCDYACLRAQDDSQYLPASGKSKVLDIQQDPVEQGFVNHSYDLVISTNLLGAGGSLETAIMHLRRLLKHGGRLILTEDEFQDPKELQKDLLRSSFNGIDLVIKDIDPARSGSILVSKAIVAACQTPLLPIEVMAEEGMEHAASNLCSALRSRGYNTSLTALGERVTKDPTICVIIDNGQKPLLVKPTVKKYKRISDLLTGKSNILWISAQENVTYAMNPEKGLVMGLARSTRAENEDLRIVTFDVQEAVDRWSPKLLCTIADILLASFSSPKQDHRLQEAEYIYRDSQVLIPRLIPDNNLDTWIGRGPGNLAIEIGLYGEPGRPLKLGNSLSGSTESPYFVDDELLEGSMDPSAVEIAVKAHGLDPRDIATATGQSNPPTPILRELAGIVSAAGSKASRKFRVGDRVCALIYQAAPYASSARVDSESVFRLPDSLSLAMGAAIPVALTTAYHCLVGLGGLQKGQVVLIHGASSNVGQAALTIAITLGAEVLATVSNIAEREDLMIRFNLPTTHIIPDKGPSLRISVLGATQGRELDVVVNTLGPASILESWDCTASFGVYIYIGKPEKHSSNREHNLSLNKNATFISFDLATLACCKPQKTAELFTTAMSMIEAGALVPNQRVTSMPIAEIKEAFRSIKNRKHLGKIVLEADIHTRVMVLSNRRRLFQLDADGTYVIAGGLGDLGQKLCRLLVSRGATRIAILSRRAWEQDRLQRFQDELQLLRPGVTIHAMACDISSRSALQEVMASLSQVGSPPVKGLLQSATVLKDSTFERMTADNFQIPLQSKLVGTQNLVEAFKDLPLDFFVMLSSLSGLVGTRGQANYAAGNTFQDSLAQSQMNTRTHYMAVDLGMIEGTTAYENNEGQNRTRNLLRQGWKPVKAEDLLAVLDYAISPHARKDKCRQAVIGIDGRSIFEADNATPATNSALFVHVRNSHDITAPTQPDIDPKSHKQTISDAQSLDEVLHIITEAIAQRLCSLVALDYEKVNVEIPLSDFGLDSLTAIELKNWVAQEFDAAIQASEILDEPSIKALATRTASRSTIIQGQCLDVSVDEHTKGYNQHKTDSREILGGHVGINGLQNGNAASILPRLPLPDLESTLELYLTSARPFQSEDERKRSSSIALEFREGFGQQLQRRLTDRTQDPNLENWQCDLQVNSIYLKRRDPVYPYGIFYGSHLVTKIPHTQAERAAIISGAAYKFKQMIAAGDVKQDYLNEEPLCMHSLQWLFGANREPCFGVDKVSRHSASDYLVALRCGHIFKVMLTNDEKDESYNSLLATFEAILNSSVESLPSIATLTADRRDSWVELRATVKSIDEANNALVCMIEAATFVVCLEDASPTTPSERSNQFLLGDPSNRWSDKSLQFVVCQNGVSAYVCEHSMLDAASVKQMNEFVTKAILEHKPIVQLNGNTHSTGESRHADHRLLDGESTHCPRNLAERFTFTITPALESNVARVRNEFKQRHPPIEYTRFYLPLFGKTFLRTHKLPFKTGYQLVIQLAAWLHFGRQYPSWEVLTMMHFHQGRLDWIQAVSPAMAAFCRRAMDDGVPAREHRVRLREAATVHAKTMARVGRGRGFAAHLEALREVLRTDEDVPTLFRDSTWEMMHVTGTRKIKTDTSERLMAQEAGFLMPDPESVLVHYEVEEGGCGFDVQGTEGRTEAFGVALRRAAERVKAILEV
ncbi:hypothetical protein MMC30_002609 [Trapelia coarctata]|nr:hypothetical protein [Trapelia coarctata]